MLPQTLFTSYSTEKRLRTRFSTSQLINCTHPPPHQVYDTLDIIQESEKLVKNNTEENKNWNILLMMNSMIGLTHGNKKNILCFVEQVCRTSFRD
jgi:lipopolysaccharide biosynthesis regulator YciM